jgi:hypothetical protein
MNTFLCQKSKLIAFICKFGEGLHLHGETLIVSSLVVALISFCLVLGTSIQRGWFTKRFRSNLRISKYYITQMGPSYYARFLPFITTIFLFVLGSKSSSSLEIN